MLPRRVTVPSEGFKSPAASERTVLFPQPEGPIMAANSPSPREKESPFKAVTSPRLVW